MNNSAGLKSFKIFALVSTIATYFLIFAGGLVRVSGAGLGCPDWPKCFGRWIPPTDISQLPPDIDPNLFNFTLAWIEYINRLLGVIVGLLIAATAVWALVRARKYPKIVISAVAAALLTALQGWQGSQVVASALEPFIITIHMTLAFIIVSLLLFTTLQAYIIENPYLQTESRKRLKGFLSIAYVVTILQIILGTEMRSGVQLLSDRFPALSEIDIGRQLGMINHIHMLFGVVILGFCGHITHIMLREKFYVNPLLRNSVWIINIATFLQVIAGFVLLYAGMPALVQLVHLWLASIIIGGMLIIHGTLKRGETTA